MEKERFEALLLLQIHREDTPSYDAVLDHFAATSARPLKFILLTVQCCVIYCQAQLLVPVRLMCTWCRPVILYKISFLCQHVKSLALMFSVCTDSE